MQNTHDENTRFYKYIVIWAWEFGMLKIPVRWARSKQTWSHHVQNRPSCARQNDVLQINIQDRLGK